MTVAYSAHTTHPDFFTGFTPADVESSIPARFEQMVRQFPNHTAVAANQRYSYAELNRRANLIAQAILKRCGEGNEPVALLLGHDAPAIAAILGVLKAGKIYVALNPAQPPARLRMLLDDLPTRLIITDAEHRALSTDLARATEQILNLDKLDNAPDRGRSEQILNLDKLGNAPDRGRSVRDSASADGTSAIQLAAIFFTSGSTGEPKGFARDHRTILHRIRLDTNSDRLTAQDRFSLLFLCSYGTSVSDVFDALLNGGTVTMFDPNARGLGELTDWLRAEQVTSLHIPVALFRQWLETLGEDDFFPALRRLRPAGQLFRGDLERLWPHLPEHAQVFSQLASSETVLVTRTAFSRHSAIDTEVLHVGAPVAETEVFLVNEAGQRVTNGEPGRIHVRSRYLSSGYWRRPDLTAEVFLPDPAGGEFRICKTGDWGRWRRDGNLEFLGRRDAMVKVRGYRVELSEIEAALRKLPEVRAAAVTARDDAQDGKRVIAYVVPARNAAPTVSALRAALAETLPEQSIPAAFVMLAELPLLPNGKLDALALPAPERTRPVLEAPFVVPRTPDEITLAGIWAEVLEMDGLGVDDHFLELGGNSLRAMRICVRASRAFGVELPPRLLFDAPTIARMAVEVRSVEVGRAGSPRPHASGTLAFPDASVPLALPEAALPGALSFAQQRLWLADRVLPDNSVYNVARVYRLNGELNVAALEQSLNLIVARHATLRTTFAVSDGVPRQTIHPPRPVEFPVVDLSRLPADEADAEVKRQTDAESARPFDLTCDLMIRARLLRLNAREHWLIVVKHHIATDGWSANILWREMADCYEAFANGRTPDLPLLPVDYAAYAVWQRERWESGAWQLQLDYWRRKLAGAPPLLELPTDRPRPAERTFRGALLTVEFPAALVAELKGWLRREQLTLYWGLLAAFKILLLRYTGQQDLVVGTPAAGRPHPSLENVLGCFLNDLVLRTELNNDLSVREALTRVRQTVLEAFANQDAPFEAVLEAVQPERSRSRAPLFQVMFNLLTLPPFDKQFGNLEAKRILLDNQTAKLDLAFAMRESEDALTGYFEYNRDLFDEATIRRLFAHYLNLLRAMVEDTSQRVGQLPMLDAAEHKTLLVEWNATATAYPREHCIHQLFDAQAARAPEAIAVTAGAQRLTYREVQEQANSLAHRLRARGIGGGAVVGVLLERSPQMIVAWLAILKAGGAYLPLDPNEPQARLRQMLEDAQTPLLVTQQKLRASLDGTTAPLFCVDEVADSTESQSAADCRLPTTNCHLPTADCRLSSESLAYVMYTSGSTGQPKGVAIPHRAVVRLVRDTNYVQLGADDCLAQVSHVAFDAATFEVWGALLNGGRLALIPADVVLSPKAFARQLKEENVTTLFLTTALFNLMAKSEPAAFRSLRNLLFGGEACDPQCARAVLEHGAPQRLLHVYGPTESTTFATWHLVESVPPDAATVPIGRPVSNTTVYVLDSQLQPVPVGVTGELFIGGDGLAREYLGQPDLTAEKFLNAECGMLNAESDASTNSSTGETVGLRQSAFRVPHSALRIYKTGDLVRWLPDGTLEFVGRKDQQIKLRGFRIELGEIETALLRHPAVSQAVVVARSQREGLALLAYVVATSPVKGSEMLAWLKPQLPGYMLPAAVMALDALPLTANGKLDRAALPAPAELSVSKTATAPRDVLEWRLTKIWEETLRMKPIGVTDNFFDLGGHSLLAVQLFDRIARATGKELPVSVLYQAPTVEELAELLRQGDWTPPWEALVPLRPQGHKSPLFLAPPGASTVLRFNRLVRQLDPAWPVYGLSYRGMDGQTAPHEKLEEMAAYHLAEMRRLQPRGPYFLAGICFGAHLMFELAQQLRAAGEQIALLAVLDAAPPANGPDWDFEHMSWYVPRERYHRVRRIREEWQHGKLLRTLWSVAQFTVGQKWRYFTDSVWRRARPASAAHYRAEHFYRAEPFAGRLLLLQSEELQARKGFTERWRSLSVGEFEQAVVTGSHRETLLQEPHVSRLAETLSRGLNNTAALLGL